MALDGTSASPVLYVDAPPLAPASPSFLEHQAGGRPQDGGGRYGSGGDGEVMDEARQMSAPWGFDDYFSLPGVEHAGELFNDTDLTSWLREAVDGGGPYAPGFELAQRKDKAPQRSDSSADASEQDSVLDLPSSAMGPSGGMARSTGLRRGRGMPRAISMPSLSLAHGKQGSSPSSPRNYEQPMQLPHCGLLEMRALPREAPLHEGGFAMPRSKSSNCLPSAAGGPARGLSSAASSPRDADGDTPPVVLPAAGAGPPTAVWHAQMGLAPRRKGKGGRQPAQDPRLDPNMDPKKARRIVANRISAAKSKLKQKGEIEVLKGQLQAINARLEVMQQQQCVMQSHCSGLEEANRQLQTKAQLLRNMRAVQDAMHSKLVGQLQEARVQALGSGARGGGEERRSAVDGVGIKAEEGEGEAMAI